MALDADPAGECDVAVVGAGIVGLATARELAERHPRLSIRVLERESEPATHQTGRNSGVVHAGIYYAPGSLKARLCVEGARLLYDHCERHGIPHERCGKVVVATEASELPALAELERRGHANRVPGLRRLDAAELTELEPHARGLAALHSPATGIVDFGAVARSLGHELAERGGDVATGCPVTGAGPAGRRLALRTPRGQVRARHAVFCAGLWADRMAVACGGPADPRIVPFRGAYLRLRPERRDLVRALIYPVPDPRLPFLGVHLSRHQSGEVLIGPTALLAPARDAYRLRTVRPRDVAATLAWPGTWRLVRRFWRTGAGELRHALSPRSLTAAAARYVPDLRPADVLAGPAGVRAQALARDGTLLDDFAFSRTERALHVRNAPSPAATSALAIARLIADRAESELGVGV
ncbi:MAG: (S)-2-hydroxyglutarate dehydrogenase [Thermoleophilaceae bacterium]|nr:(S)-2-hydroxyglutarate dehydrogenase [Thermoleophilaceae bacterium]